GRQRLEKPTVLAAGVGVAPQRPVQKGEVNTQRRGALLPRELFLQRGGDLRPETRAHRRPRQLPRLVSEPRRGPESSERLQERARGRAGGADMLIAAREERFILGGVLALHQLQDQSQRFGVVAVLLQRLDQRA